MSFLTNYVAMRFIAYILSYVCLCDGITTAYFLGGLVRCGYILFCFCSFCFYFWSFKYLSFCVMIFCYFPILHLCLLLFFFIFNICISCCCCVQKCCILFLCVFQDWLSLFSLCCSNVSVLFWLSTKNLFESWVFGVISLLA